MIAATTDQRLDALLIAGGHGRRAGGPKALKIMDGMPMWCWQVAALRNAGCGRIVAVLHPDAMPSHPDVVPLDTTVIAADPDGEMLASIQWGLATLADLPTSPSADSAPPPVLLLPVDCPCPAVQVFDALRKAAFSPENQGLSWKTIQPWAPTEAGPRRGHPVVLSPAWLATVRSADAKTGRLDRLIRALPSAQRLDVEVADRSIWSNLNDKNWPTTR